jgi:xanthine dehydrogenase accessory factor
MSYRVSFIYGDQNSKKSVSIKATPQTAIVVATQGEDDEGALEKALSLEVPYVAFVASTKKWEAVSSYLREKGFQEERLKKVKVPAGLDIAAGSPEEIAVSILAQTIQVRRQLKRAELPKLPLIETARAKDPVCGMTVNVSEAKYVTDLDHQKYYFCCAHCQSSFEKEPGQFLTAGM